MIILVETFRKCMRCIKLVPGKPLGTEIHLCENHKEDKSYAVSRILSERYIKIDFFRVYDENRKQLCLICGKERVGRTFCADHNSMDYEIEVNLKFNCSVIADHILYKENETCQICGLKQERSDRYDQYGYQRGYYRYRFEVHHIIPVHKLDETNWELCFNHNNLLLLCEKCHKLIHSKTKPELDYLAPSKIKKYKSITDW